MYYHTYVAVYVVTHSGMDPGGPLLPALRNSGRFLTIPLTAFLLAVQTSDGGGGHSDIWMYYTREQ